MIVDGVNHRDGDASEPGHGPGVEGLEVGPSTAEHHAQPVSGRRLHGVGEGAVAQDGPERLAEADRRRQFGFAGVDARLDEPVLAEVT